MSSPVGQIRGFDMIMPTLCGIPNLAAWQEGGYNMPEIENE